MRRVGKGICIKRVSCSIGFPDVSTKLRYLESLFRELISKPTTTSSQEVSRPAASIVNAGISKAEELSVRLSVIES